MDELTCPCPKSITKDNIFRIGIEPGCPLHDPNYKNIINNLYLDKEKEGEVN